MSTDTTVRTVLEDVEADPDAIFEAHGATTPAELIAAGGDHDPVPDDAIDAHDITATELFAELETLPSNHGPGSANEPPAGEPSMATVTDDAESADADTVFVGEPAATVRRDDSVDADASAAAIWRRSDPPIGGEVTGSSVGGETADPSTDGEPADSSIDLELVGPAPTPTRIPNDAFGVSALEGSRTAETEFRWLEGANAGR